MLIVERRLPAYRVALFEALRVALAARGIELALAHGQPRAEERSKRDEGELAWAQRLPTRYLGPLCWQPFDARGFDLIIAGHENGLLFNHWLCRPWRGFRLAYFGHGADFAAAAPGGLRAAFKRWTARQADAWLAYTEHSAAKLRLAGVAAERIHVVNNAVAAGPANVERHKPGKTAVFIGSLYPAKRLDLLLAAAEQCAMSDADFRLIVIGDGELAPLLRDAAHRHARWLAWHGAIHGVQREALLAQADVLLLPAAVGLAILDGFAAGLPLLTTHAPGHGPELAYLQAGLNGELTAPNPPTYAQAILALLGDAPRLQAMRAAAWQAAQRHTLAAMVVRFVAGIEAALARPR